MLRFYKETALKSIARQRTANFLILKIDLFHMEVLLQDIDIKPPLDVWVTLTPEYVQQAMHWAVGRQLYATIIVDIFTIEEKVKGKGWSKNDLEKALRETGYSWNDALANYYFDGKVEERT